MPPLKPSSTEATAVTLEGVTFEGVDSRDCRGLDPPARRAETFASVFQGDLIQFQILYGGDGTRDEGARRLFFAMIGSALVRRMNP